MKQANAGRLDRRITIERPTYETDEFGGAAVSAWVPIGTGSASGNGLAGGSFAADVRDILQVDEAARLQHA